MKIVRNLTPINGWPWGWGAEKIAAADRACTRCGQHPKTKDASLHHYRGGRIRLCTPCARRTCQRAFRRPFTVEEIRAFRFGSACSAVPMSDELATLFIRPEKQGLLVPLHNR